MYNIRKYKIISNVIMLSYRRYRGSGVFSVNKR